MLFSTYSEFWLHYLKEHSNPRNRWLHFVGTSLALLALGFAILQGDLRWILVALVAGYGSAWIGHFWVEGNRPATFRYPLWSLFSDLRLWGLMLRGRPLR